MKRQLEGAPPSGPPGPPHLSSGQPPCWPLSPQPCPAPVRPECRFSGFLLGFTFPVAYSLGSRPLIGLWWFVPDPVPPTPAVPSASILHALSCLLIFVPAIPSAWNASPCSLTGIQLIPHSRNISSMTSTCPGQAELVPLLCYIVPVHGCHFTHHVSDCQLIYGPPPVSPNFSWGELVTAPLKHGTCGSALTRPVVSFLHLPGARWWREATAFFTEDRGHRDGCDVGGRAGSPIRRRLDGAGERRWADADAL